MLNGKYNFFRLGLNTVKVLPLVYDDSLSYYEQICRLMFYVNDLAKYVDEEVPRLIRELTPGIVDEALQNYGLVDNYDSSTETLTLTLKRG